MFGCISWAREEVDEKLHKIMMAIHKNCFETAEQYGAPGNLANGVNIAGFLGICQDLASSKKELVKSLSLAAVGLSLFSFCVEGAQAQSPIQKSAAKACAVMSGQSKPDGQTLQLLTMLQERLDPTDSVAYLLTREVMKQCPKDYLNYQQRVRANNPFAPGSPNSVDLTPGLTKQGPANLTPGSGAALTKSSAEPHKPGKALTVKETSKDTRLTLSADVLFDFDKAIIRSDGAGALQRVATLVRDKNHGIVRIEGYTDSKGAEDHNKRLSEQRADAVKTWLVKNGSFNVSTFSTRGRGASHPVARNTKPDGTDDPAGRQRNRRVELVIAK